MKARMHDNRFPDYAGGSRQPASFTRSRRDIQIRDRAERPAFCRRATGQAHRSSTFTRYSSTILAAVLIGLTAMYGVAGGQSHPRTFVENLLSKQSELIPSPDVPIAVYAERGSFDAKKNVYTARGNVTLMVGAYRLRADSVAINVDKRTVTAQGDIIVRLGSELIEADKLIFDIGKFTGVLHNGKILLSRHNIYMEFEKLRKTDDHTYKIEEGSYTTCNGVTPDWRIAGQNLDVTLDGYATLRHGFLHVRDIPVFYIPWLVYPAKRQRTTGFLMPTLSSSTMKGFDIRFPFFLNISPSFDATIVPRICTKRAAQASLEFRYLPHESFRGRFYGEYTYDWHFATETGPKTHRFYLTWNHDQSFPGEVRLKANGTWLSDRDYFELWGDRLGRRKRLRYVESTAVLNRQWNNFLFQAEARHFDDLNIPDNAVTMQNLPIATLTSFNQQIPYTPFYLGSTLDYSNFYAPFMHQQWFGSRIRMDARLSLPVALGRYLKMEPSITFLPTAYWARYVENDRTTISLDTIRTDLYQVSADVLTDLHSVYNTPFLGFQRFRHSIRPRIAWTFRPLVDQKAYPIFDDSDRVDSISRLTAEIRHTLTGRLAPGEYLDFLTLSVSQAYDFLTPRPVEDALEAGLLPQYHLTNTRAEVTLRPHSLVDLVAQAEYDPVQNRAKKYSLDLGLMDHRGDLVRVVHQFTEDEKHENLNRQTNVSLQLKLTSALECYFQSQYTHQFNFSYFTSFGLAYHPQCWSLGLKYSEAREQDLVTRKITEPDQTVFVTVSMGQMGPIYSMTHDWREILGRSSDSKAAEKQ